MCRAAIVHTPQNDNVESVHCRTKHTLSCQRNTQNDTEYMPCSACSQPTTCYVMTTKLHAHTYIVEVTYIVK